MSVYGLIIGIRIFITHLKSMIIKKRILVFNFIYDSFIYLQVLLH
ncbi:hypothetical protein [Candidatus Portiera aleyrodidarum]|nr:hypothetical protein [Candidatus Portiera aleyrodidarum]